MKNPRERMGEIATNQEGVDGVIRHWDESKQRFVGHRLDDDSRYWQAKKPKFTGIRFVDYEKAKKHEEKTVGDN